jgi:Flp pilus assembly protein TadG
LATAERISFWDDEGGATVLEFTVGMMTFFVILFGIIEFSYIFYQWNAATKAVQFGARLAAVSEPVATDLTTMTGLSGGAIPGGAMAPFDITCYGASASCVGGDGSYSDDAMRVIVYGRDSTGTTNTQCGTTAVTNPLQNGMCNYFSSIAPENVVIRYQYTGLGYAGRPGGPNHTGGPVPTITVSVTGITYSFTFLNGLMGFSTATVPGLATTVTGEDLNAAGS